MIARALSWRGRPLLLNCDSTVRSSSPGQTAFLEISEAMPSIDVLGSICPPSLSAPSPFCGYLRLIPFPGNQFLSSKWP